MGEVGREAGDLDRNGGSRGEGERLDPSARGVRLLVGIAPEKLLPESAAVLARVLPGQAVDVPEPLHRDEEPLVGSEAGRAQFGDLVPKMILELVDVAAVDARRVLDISPPLRDLRLDALHAHASPRAVSTAPEPGQTSFSARVTVIHCCCCSASAARPAFVIA